MEAAIARLRDHRDSTRPFRSFLRTPATVVSLPPALSSLLSSLPPPPHSHTHTYPRPSPSPSPSSSPSPPSPSLPPAFNLPLRYAATYRVLLEVAQRLPSFLPRTILDAHFDDGATAWAVREVWGEEGGEGGYRGVMGVGGGGGRGGGVGKEVTAELRLPLTLTPALLKPVQPPVDLVVCAFTGGERVGGGGGAGRAAWLHRLWASVRRGGVLVLVEDGTQEGFEVIRSARQHILQTYTSPSPSAHSPSPSPSPSLPTHPWLPPLPSPPSLSPPAPPPPPPPPPPSSPPALTTPPAHAAPRLAHARSARGCCRRRCRWGRSGGR